jgi:hypothetical protein
MRTGMTMFRSLNTWMAKAALTLALATAAATAVQAAPVHIDLQTLGVGLGPSTAYGQGANLIDLGFAPVASTTHWAADLNVGNSLSFTWGTASLTEEGGNNASFETREVAGKSLLLNGLFSFTAGSLPAQGITVGSTVNVFLGELSDPAPDLHVDWLDQEIAFGNGAKLLLSLNDLSFTQNSTTLDLTGTLTLLSAAADAGTGTGTGTGTNNTGSNNEGGVPLYHPLPEPGSLALTGAGLLGLAVMRRQRPEAQKD